MQKRRAISRFLAGLLVLCMVLTGAPSWSLRVLANGDGNGNGQSGNESDTATVKKVYGAFVEGEDGPKLDATSLVIAPDKPEGKELIAKLISDGTYTLQEGDLEISLALNDASLFMADSECNTLPEGWEMAGNSAISYGNMVVTSNPEDFPAYEGSLDDIGGVFGFFGSFPYSDELDEHGNVMRYRLSYDYTVTGDFTTTEILANVLTIEEGATLTLAPLKFFDYENNKWDDLTSGGMFNGNKLVLNGTIKTLAAERDENPPVIGVYDNGEFQVGEHGTFDVCPWTELVYGNFSPMNDGIKLYARSREPGHEGEIISYVYNPNHGREVFVWNGIDEKWICEEPSLANWAIIVRYEEHRDDETQEPRAKVVVNDKPVARDEIGSFAVDEPLKFELYYPEERKGCVPVVRIESGFGNQYQDWATWYPEGDQQIVLTENKEKKCFEFTYTPTRTDGLNVNVAWSDFDSFWPGENAFTLEVADGWADDGTNAVTISITPESDHKMQEPNGGISTKRGYSNDIFENNGKIQLDFTVVEGYQLDYVTLNEGWNERHYVPGPATENWQTPMEGNGFTINADGSFTYVLDHVPNDQYLMVSVGCSELPASVSVETWGLETQYRIGSSGEFQKLEPDDNDQYELTREQIIDAEQVSIKFIPEAEDKPVYGVKVRWDKGPDNIDCHYLNQEGAYTIYKGDGWKDYRVSPITRDVPMNGEFMIQPRDTETLTLGDGLKAYTKYEFEIGTPITVNVTENVYRVIVSIEERELEEIIPENGSFTYVPKYRQGIMFDVFTTKEAYELNQFDANHEEGELSASYFIHMNDWVEGVNGEVTLEEEPIRSMSVNGQTKVIYYVADELLVTMTVKPDVGSTYIFREEGRDITEQVMANNNQYVWNLSEPWNIAHLEVDFQPQEYDIAIEGGHANKDKTCMKDTVYIGTDMPEGKIFDKWVVVSGDVEIDNPNSQSTFFVMGTSDVSIRAEYKDEGFQLAGANMNLGNALAMNFYIYKSDIDENQDYFVEITKANVNAAPTVRRIPKEKWSTYGTNMYRISFTGLAAKEMNDEIKVQVFYADGRVASQLWVDGISAYVKRAFNSQNVYAKSVMVDMLNYGAAAQIAQDYDKENLANAWMEADQQQYASEEVTCDSHQDKILNYEGANLNLGNNLCLNMYFHNISGAAYADLTYLNRKNKECTIRVSANKFIPFNEELTAVRVEILSVAEAKSVVNCKVYDKAGKLLAEGEDSIEGYIARQTKKSDLFKAIMKFSASAFTCLQENDKK